MARNVYETRILQPKRQSLPRSLYCRPVFASGTLVHHEQYTYTAPRPTLIFPIYILTIFLFYRSYCVNLTLSVFSKRVLLNYRQVLPDCLASVYLSNYLTLATGSFFIS
jgi:hypothetical protein